MARGKRHIHKYMRVTLSYASVWRCALPDCNHHMPKHMEPLIEGRNSICWGCGEPFRLDEITMREEMPMCISCSNPEFNEIDTILPKQAGS